MTNSETKIFARLSGMLPKYFEYLHEAFPDADLRMLLAIHGPSRRIVTTVAHWLDAP